MDQGAGSCYIQSAGSAQAGAEGEGGLMGNRNTVPEITAIQIGAGTRRGSVNAVGEGVGVASNDTEAAICGAR